MSSIEYGVKNIVHLRVSSVVENTELFFTAQEMTEGYKNDTVLTVCMILLAIFHNTQCGVCGEYLYPRASLFLVPNPSPPASCKNNLIFVSYLLEGDTDTFTSMMGKIVYKSVHHKP